MRAVDNSQEPQFSISNYREDDHYLRVGNITFLCNATSPAVTPRQIYYHFTFRDNTTEREYTSSNVTHFYIQPGNVTYLVEAIAAIDDYEAYHTLYEDYIILQGKLTKVCNIHTYRLMLF